MHGAGMFATIDGEFAKVLGYENLVGGYCMISDVMDAICGVTILKANDTALVGSQHDIHKQDLKLQDYYEGEEDKKLYVFIDYRSYKIYFSKNEELILYVADVIFAKPVEYFPEIKEIHEIIDLLGKNHPGYSFHPVSLDHPDKRDTGVIEWVKSFERHKGAEKKVEDILVNHKKAMKDAGFGPSAKKTKVNRALTEQLKKQMIEKAEQDVHQGRTDKKQDLSDLDAFWD